MTKKEQLIKNYKKNSKHSSYQILPRRLKKIIDNEDLHTKSRFENERLNYILEKINMKGKSVLDIGGNTGFFTLESIDAGAKNVTYYDGNKNHANFVNIAKEVLSLEKSIDIKSEYFNFDNDNNYDIILLLNVLHHVGDDYGDKNITINNVQQTILKQLNQTSKITDLLVFQLGFNWRGDTKKCLFKNGTKKEMINFIKNGTHHNWDILNIGIAEEHDGKIKYFDLNKKNIERNDKLGEFLNRPLFIMKSKIK